jgi:hypothetical protein
MNGARRELVHTVDEIAKGVPKKKGSFSEASEKRDELLGQPQRDGPPYCLGICLAFSFKVFAIAVSANGIPENCERGLLGKYTGHSRIRP